MGGGSTIPDSRVRHKSVKEHGVGGEGESKSNNQVTRNKNNCSEG